MKTQNLKYFIFTLALLFSATNLNLMAQNEQGDEERKEQRRHWRSHRGSPDRQDRIFNIPGLSDEQKEQIKKVRLEMQKEVLPLRNEMREKRARLNTLSTVEKADMNAINQVVEDIGGLQTELMKKREMGKQQVRSLLNEEQRLFFDSHQRGMRHFRHSKHGRG